MATGDAGMLMLGGLLQVSHRCSLDELPRLVREHAAPAGLRDAVIYLADRQQERLLPCWPAAGTPGPGVDRQPLHTLARQRRGHRLFDESGISLTPIMRSTWAPKGHTPVICHHFNWKRVSMAAALCYGSHGGGCRLALHFQPGSYNTKT